MSAEIRAIGDRKNNAELILDCHHLGYLRDDDFVVDPTYGQGRFWKLWHPKGAAWFSDLDPDCSPVGWSVDARNLPFDDGQVDVTVVDPPYKLNGTSTGVGASGLDDSYGVDAYQSTSERHLLMSEMLAEALRISKRHVLFKCQDQVSSGRVQWQTIQFANCGLNAGWRLVDMLHVQGYRKQPAGRTQKHARRDYSTMLVFGR